MRRFLCSAAGLALVLLLMPSQAAADCGDLAFERVEDPRNPEYDAYAGDNIDDDWVIILNRTKRGRCDARITITGAATGGFSRSLTGPFGDVILYELESDDGVVIRDESDPDSGLFVRFDNQSSTAEARVRLRIPGSQLVRAGDYSQALTLRLYQNRRNTLQDLQTVTNRLDVRARAEINLSLQGGLGFDTGASFETLDFGELESGETGGLFLRARANVDYMLTLNSANRGVLIRENARSPDELDRIDYAMTLNGDPVDLSAPRLLSLPANTPRALEELPVIIRIGEVGQARSGRYRDQVSVYIEAVR